MESQKKAPTSAQPAARPADEVEHGGIPFGATVQKLSCLDPDALTIDVHYELSQKVFGKLCALAVLMDRGRTRVFATALRTLLAEVECVLP